MKVLTILTTCLCLATPALAAPPPKIIKASDGIFAAFHDHPLVGLGEWHGLAQEVDFYAALVRDPRLAKEVGNIVVEMGDAAQQDVVDRYVNGESVSYLELRKVWSDTVGIFPTVQDLGNINLYAVVRAVNAGLPPESRIKVWLGDPPINWSQVNSKEEWQRLEEQRDIYPAGLIEREILGKQKKALVIYGVDHLDVYPDGIAPFPPPAIVQHRSPNMRARFDANHPGALFTVFPYIGFTTKPCSERFERHLKGVPIPSLIVSVRESAWEKDVLPPGCVPVAKSPGLTQAQYEAAIRNYAGFNSDGLLYLGARQSLTTSPNVPDLYLDLDFRREMDRRLRLRIGTGLSAVPDPAYNPATPQPYDPG